MSPFPHVAVGLSVMAGTLAVGIGLYMSGRAKRDRWWWRSLAASGAFTVGVHVYGLLLLSGAFDFPA